MFLKNLLIGLALTTQAHAANFQGVAWDYPRTGPLPKHWNLMMTWVRGESAGQNVLPLTPTDEATCRQWQGTGWTPETWCAAVPCPGPGGYQLLLQAEGSLPTNLVEFSIGDGPECPAEGFEKVARPPSLPPPGTAPPGTEPPPVPAPPAPDTPSVRQEPKEPGVPTPPEPSIASRPPIPEDQQRDTAQLILDNLVHLEQEYLARLQKIEADYLAAMAQVQSRREQRRVYQRATARQRQTYRRARREWQRWYRHYARVTEGETSQE